LTKDQVKILFDTVVRLSERIDELTKPNCSSRELTEYSRVKRLFMHLMETPLLGRNRLQNIVTEIELYEYNDKLKNFQLVSGAGGKVDMR
jgi:hypothetical protein